VQSEIAGAFSNQDVLIQSTLASQVAIALQNAELYREQLETAKQLREVDRLKTEFLARMSHELRTPLNAIIGFSDVLLEGLDGPLNERMEEDVTVIRDSGLHLKELIGDILDLSKIEAGMMTLNLQTVDISMVCDEVMATSQGLAFAKNILLKLDLSEEVKPISIDRTRIKQVLINLVGNAIKFTDKGGVTIAVKDEPEQMRFEVTDTGIGIAQENIELVFEEFRQVDGSLTRQSGGTGLGIPISKRLVELHGGVMGVESEIDVGSTFWFTLPRILDV
jgi:signal transduction histidine kinase